MVWQNITSMMEDSSPVASLIVCVKLVKTPYKWTNKHAQDYDTVCKRDRMEPRDLKAYFGT